MTVTSEPVFIDRIETLPPLPAVASRLLSMTGSATHSAPEIARVLSQDQAIAAKVLRVANSSFYGAGRQVSQISRAVVMLGNAGVRNLVMGIAARNAFPTVRGHLPEHNILWRRSVAVATASEEIARLVHFPLVEEAFVTGLLHDIGQLAMMTFDPDVYGRILGERAHGDRLCAAEREYFDIDHTEAGFRILGRWGLPEAICQVVLRHHERSIDTGEASSRLLTIVMLADTVVQMMGFGFDLPAGELRQADQAVQLLGIDQALQSRFLAGLPPRIAQAVEMLADEDGVQWPIEQKISKRAVWVSFERCTGFCICQLLLEHWGYEVLEAKPEKLAGKISPDDIVILTPSEDGSAGDLACELVHRGFGKVVLLWDEIQDSGARRRDAETGVCHIPRLFTRFDIQWVEGAVLDHEQRRSHC